MEEKDNNNSHKTNNENTENTSIFLAENKNKVEMKEENKEENKENVKSQPLNYSNLILYEPESTKIEILKEDKKPIDFHFKVIVIGNSGVGKSSLSLRATQDIFKEDFISTIGFEFYSFYLKINDKTIKLQIWDTCGQEIYRSIISGFYRSTELAIIVFSVVDRKSFEDIEEWVKQLKTHGTPDCKIFLIGNKIDLQNRMVSSEEAIKYKKEHDFEYYMETSARAGVNIRELFVNCGLILYNKYLKEVKDEDEIDGDDGNFNLNRGIKEEENDCQC